MSIMNVRFRKYKYVNNERNTGNINMSMMNVNTGNINMSIMNVIQEIYVNNERNTGNINMSIMNIIQEI